MYSVLVIEDDNTAADHIRSMLENCPHSRILHVTHADVAALDVLLGENQAPNIAIVDIELGDNCENGIDLVKRCFPETSRTQIIYATGHIEYCTAVYQTAHVSFLVKPLRQTELNFALNKALANIRKVQRELFPIHTGNTVKMIPAGSIEYLESKLRKVTIHFNGKEFQMYATLSDVESKLPSYFIRCHKSFLVNMNHIVEVKTNSLLLQSGVVVPVSQGRRKEVRKQFTGFLAMPYSQ